MGDLDGVLGRGEESGIGQRPQQLLQLERLLPLGAQLVEGDAASGVLRAFAELREPDEDRTCQPLLALRKLDVDGLGGSGDGAPHPAALAKARQREGSVRASLPGLQKRVRQQGERPRFARNVAQHQIDETALDGEPSDPGRTLDCRAELRFVHGPQQGRRRLERRAESRYRRAETEEVRPHGDQDEHRAAVRGCRAQKGIDEHAALGRVGAEREDLLELVDEHDQPLDVRALHGDGESSRIPIEQPEKRARPLLQRSRTRRGELGQRMGPRGEHRDRPLVASKQCASAKGRQHARAHDR